MQSEIIRCPICKTEYDLLYDKNDEVWHQTNCRCNYQNKTIKKLDAALKQLEDYYEKLISKN